MAYMIIHCEVCGGTWEVYHRDNWNDTKAAQCPHCFTQIDPQIWKNQVLPAFGLVHDANAELYKHSVGYRSPLFTFDVISDTQYADRWADIDADENEDELSIDIGDLDLSDLVI